MSREWIAQFSIPRAKARLARIKEEAEMPEKTRMAAQQEVQKRVKLVDTASFTLGIVMVMTAEFLLVGYPRGFPWFYLILNTMLMMLR